MHCSGLTNPLSYFPTFTILILSPILPQPALCIEWQSPTQFISLTPRTSPQLWTRFLSVEPVRGGTLPCSIYGRWPLPLTIEKWVQRDVEFFHLFVYTFRSLVSLIADSEENPRELHKEFDTVCKTRKLKVNSGKIKVKNDMKEIG